MIAPGVKKKKKGTVQFFAYKMTVASENSILKHRNVNLNTVSLKASDCTKIQVDVIDVIIFCPISNY
jgi:hypothetical protein